jgi:hypothetical protein
MDDPERTVERTVVEPVTESGTEVVTTCLKDDNSDETKSCRGMRIVTLIDTLRRRYNTSENIEQNLPEIGKTIRETLETNGIKDIPPEQLSDIFDSFDIDPSHLDVMNAIKFISPNKFKALTGITDTNTYRIVQLQLTDLMNKVNEYRKEKGITTSPPIRPAWKGGRTGKKKTIRKKSKKTMKRNSKKRGSYKKYKGGNSFFAIFVYVYGMARLCCCTTFTQEQKNDYNNEIRRLQKQITKTQTKINPKTELNLNVEILRLQNRIDEYKKNLASACS